MTLFFFLKPFFVQISEKLQNASETSSDIEPGSSSNSDGGGSSEGDDEEDDNEGWITPKNFAQVIKNIFIAFDFIERLTRI